jgi:hypothetical protein
VFYLGERERERERAKSQSNIVIKALGKNSQKKTKKVETK